MTMNLDTWLTYYRSLPGYNVSVEDDGTRYAWMVVSEAGELVDWWSLHEADKTKEIGDDGKPKTFAS